MPDAHTQPAPLAARGHLLVFALFALLTALATWPLVLHPTHIMLGTPGDSLIWPWNYSWTRQALLHEHRIPFFSEHIYRPFPMLMLHHTHTFFYGFLYTLGGFLYENPYFWNNVFIFMSFAVSGYGTFLLARHLTGQTAGALLAGTIYAFCSFRMTRAPWHLTIVSSELIPLYLYFLFRGAREARARHFLAAGLCFAATTWNEYYNGLFLILFTGWFLVLWLPLRLGGDGVPWRRRLAALVPGIVVAAVLLAPFAWGLWRTVTGYAFEADGEAERYSATWLNYLVPAARHRLFEHTLIPFYRATFTGNETEATVFFGYLALALIAWGGWAVRPKSGPYKFFLICFVFYLLLSFGPTLHVELYGFSWQLPLPYRLLQMIPFCGDFRIPARFANMVALCGAVLAAWGYAAATARLQSRSARGVLTAVLIGWVLLENLFAPFKYTFDALNPACVPVRLLERLKTDPVPGAVLKLPPCYEDWNAIWMQTLHLRPCVTGYVTRLRPCYIPYFENLDLAGWFNLNPNLPGAQAAARWDRERVARLCYFFDLRAVLIPPNTVVEPGSAQLERMLKKELLPIERSYRDGGAWLALLQKQAPHFPIVMDAGSGTDNYYFTLNFTRPQGGSRWMAGKSAQAAFRLDSPRALRMRLELGYPFHIPPGMQRLKVRVGGTVVADQPLAKGWSEQTITIPRVLTRAGYNYLDFEAAVSQSPAHAMINQDERELAIMFRKVELVPILD